MQDLQYLNNESGGDNSGWQYIQRRRNRRFVVGRNEENNYVKEVPKYTLLHVTRLHPRTKPEDLKKILINKFPEVVCEEHTSKHLLK